MPWQSPSMQKSNSSGLTSEELLIRSSSYSVLQNYMPIPTKNLLSQYIREIHQLSEHTAFD